MLPLILMVLPPGAWQMIGVALGIAICSAAIFQMLAAFFQSPQLKAIANEELAALFFTAIIIWFWVTMSGVLDVAVGGVTAMYMSPLMQTELQGLPTSHLDLAILKVDNFRLQLFSMYGRLALIDVLVSFMSTLSFNLGTLPGGVGIFSLHIAPYVPFSIISSALTQIVDGIGVLTLTMWAKKMLLLFSKTVVPLILLPIGIILRANPFSRSTGSSIIAISFALYFIFPLAVLMSSYLIFDVYAVQMDYHYTAQATPFSTTMTADDINTMAADIQKGDEDIRGTFETGGVEETSAKATETACCGPDGCSFIEKLLCSVDKIVQAVSDVRVVGPAIQTIWDTFRRMLTYSGGFFDFLFGEGSIFTPAGMITIIYSMLMEVVAKTAELFLLILVATVLEIMITVTMYRNIALLIGGEPEIAGITKII